MSQRSLYIAIGISLAVFILCMASIFAFAMQTARAASFPVDSLQREGAQVSWDFPDDDTCNVRKYRGDHPNGVYVEYFGISPSGISGLSISGGMPTQPELQDDGWIINGRIAGRIAVSNRQSVDSDGRFLLTVYRTTAGFDPDTDRFFCGTSTGWTLTIEKRVVPTPEPNPTPAPTPRPTATPSPTPVPSPQPTALPATPTPRPTPSPQPTPRTLPASHPQYNEGNEGYGDRTQIIHGDGKVHRIIDGRCYTSVYYPAPRGSTSVRIDCP